MAAIEIDDALRVRLAGAAGAFAALLLVLAAVIVMNTQALKRNRDDGIGGTAIQVERVAQPPPQQVIERKPPPPRRAPPRTEPIVGLEGALAGMDFGLPQFEEAGLLDAASILGEGTGTMTDDTVDQPPRPVVQNPMPYPARAKAQGVTGYVLLSVLIGPTGMVEKVRVLEASPPGVFDDVAVAGVRTWRFEPAQYRGEPVRVWATQRIRFDLGR
jgi:protein TonB